MSCTLTELAKTSGYARHSIKVVKSGMLRDELLVRAPTFRAYKRECAWELTDKGKLAYALECGRQTKLRANKLPIVFGLLSEYVANEESTKDHYDVVIQKCLNAGMSAYATGRLLKERGFKIGSRTVYDRARRLSGRARVQFPNYKIKDSLTDGSI
jgi:hypothetical protein